MASAALIDTSVVIDRAGRPLPDAAAVSVVTLGELRAGVDLARDGGERALRAERLSRLRRVAIALPVDEEVADRYGVLLAFARRERRMTKATDLLIVATAQATGRALFTFDDRQAALARAAGIAVAS